MHEGHDLGVLYPVGRSINGTGVTPDVEVEYEYDEDEPERIISWRRRLKL